MLQVHTYPLSDYDFPTAIRSMLDVAELNQVHRSYPPSFARLNDQDSAVHRVFYANFSRLSELYRAFVRTQVLPLFAADICVQQVPSFRVGMPDDKAVSSFHVDSDYNHQKGTVNIWVPVTRAFDTNTMWVESSPGLGDFRPIDLQPGEFLEFDAIELRHGNRINTTGKTRVSFDFRIIPLTAYRPRGLRSVNANARLELGSYYTLLTEDGSYVNIENEAAR